MQLPNPHNNASLIMGGFNSLGQGIQQVDQQNQMNAPGDEMLDAYINELLKPGTDPYVLAQKFREDGGLEFLRARATQRGQMVSPQASTPDVSAPGGQPTLSAPGSVSPAGGPQGPLGLGAMGGQMQHGDAQPRSLGEAPANNIGPMSINMRGQQVNGVPGMDALVMNAQPLAPQAPQGNFNQMAQRTVPKAQDKFAGQFNAKDQYTGGARRTVAQQQRLMPLVNTLTAAQSREQVAQTQAEAKLAQTQLTQEVRGLVAVMRQNGLDDDRIQKALMAAEGLDVKQQIAVLRAIMAIQTATIGAEATKGAATIKTNSSEENTRLKLIKDAVTSLRNQLASRDRADKYTMPDGSMGTFAEAQDALRRYEAELSHGLGVTPAPRTEGPEQPGKPLNPAPKGNVAPPTAKKTSTAVTVRYSKSRNKTQWLDKDGNVVREESGDKRGSK